MTDGVASVSRRSLEVRDSHGALRARTIAGPYTASIVGHDANARLARHAHTSAKITLLLEGSLRETTRMSELTCESGALLFRAPGEAHSNTYGPSSNRSLIIDVPVAAYEAQPVSAVLFDRLHVQRGGSAGRVARRIAREVAQPDGCSALAIEGYVLETLAMALRSREGGSGSREDGARPVDKAIEYLRAFPTSRVSLATLAQVAGVSSNRLIRAFRRHTGLTPAVCQRRMRAEWAAEEMLRTDKSIARVASEAGFADQSHLTRVFLKVFGETPGACRNRT
jgi:AraC-like DNA-binding protein